MNISFVNIRPLNYSSLNIIFLRTFLICTNVLKIFIFFIQFLDCNAPTIILQEQIIKKIELAI